jgi:sugar O-acyltransferase (sialic acid O-acetyltransferase NeuD family)
MEKKKKLVFVGDGEFAEIAYEYFTHDSDYQVVGFAVEKEYLTKESLYDLPVFALEDLEKRFPKEEYFIFIAITYTKLNRIRTRLYEYIKRKGYRLATYVSSKAFVWHNVSIGENCFIFENNVLQHHVKVGNNVILWSGNHIGHRSTIKNNCFISSHVVISGYCEIGENCFIGVNSTLADHVILGNDCFIAAGCILNKNLEEGKVCTTNAETVISKVSSLRFFKIENKENPTL